VRGKANNRITALQDEYDSLFEQSLTSTYTPYNSQVFKIQEIYYSFQSLLLSISIFDLTTKTTKISLS